MPLDGSKKFAEITMHFWDGAAQTVEGLAMGPAQGLHVPLHSPPL